MNNVSNKSVKLIKEILINKHDSQMSSFALGGIKALGGCIALTSNEHVVIRAIGGVLCGTNNPKVRKVSFIISTLGFVLAKNKKKAFNQRVITIGTNVIGLGIISYLTKP